MCDILPALVAIVDFAPKHIMITKICPANGAAT